MEATALELNGKEALFETNIPILRLKNRGKARDIYYSGKEELIIVATDRISAFDVVMPNPIPDKGWILTQISKFWFDFLKDIVPNHYITTDPNRLSEYIGFDSETRKMLTGRFMIVKKAKPLPVECIVRGYLAGSGWKEYWRRRTVCGIELPDGLLECSKLPDVIFTPSTKAEQGQHDENITYGQMENLIGRDLSRRVSEISLRLYKRASVIAESKGIIIADTKFEFGIDENGKLLLIDEVLTPDSSRFWPLDQYKPGRSQPSFDKQFLRDYLLNLAWNQQPPAPELPEEIVLQTSAKYHEAYLRLTGYDLMI